MYGLSDWIAEKKISKAEAARQIGCGEGTLHNLVTGRRKPSGRLAAKIEKVTKGKVKMQSFYPE